MSRLIRRMIWKAEILTSQVRENFLPPEKIDKDGLLKGHDVERYTFGAQLQHFLDALVAQLRQFESALNGCAPETFLKMGTLYPEMSVHEKAGLDFYIDLLRKSQLDENVPIDNAEKCLQASSGSWQKIMLICTTYFMIMNQKYQNCGPYPIEIPLQYFQNIYPLHLGSERLDHPTFLASHLKAITSGFDALAAEFGVSKILLPEGQEWVFFTIITLSISMH